MKFNTLNQFNKASLINRMKWLREAKINDVATVMKENPEFAEKVLKTIGKKGKNSLDKAKLLDYKTSLKKLLTIEF